MERSGLSYIIVWLLFCVAATPAFSQMMPDSSQHHKALDDGLIISINHLSGKSEYWDGTMLLASRSLLPVVVVIPGLQLVDGIVTHDKSLTYGGLTVLGATALTIGLQELCIKPLVKRDRPFTDLPEVVKRDPDVFGYSFPSSHAGVSMGFAVGEALQLRQWYFTIPLVLYATIVTFSRPYLGVHYPSDLLVGALIGSTVQFLAYRLEQSLYSKTTKTLAPIQSSAMGMRFSIGF